MTIMPSHQKAMSFSEHQTLDAKHHIHPFTNTKSLNQKGARVITKGEGVFVWDENGQKILDAMAGLWCVNMGYSQPKLVDAATEQLKTLPFYNTFFQTTHPSVSQLANAIAEITPEGLNRVLFAGSGSEAIDTMMRLVRFYWSIKGQPEKQVLIARHNAYHGSTLGGASLGGMKPMHQQGGPMVPNIEHIRQPYWYGEGNDLSQDEFGLICAKALEDKILEIGAERVAAFVGEPVQGAGGVIVPPASYWPEIQRICQKYNILLVADEVICGFGRTGNWFGSQTFTIQPDIITMAKGLSSGYQPIAAVAIHDRIVEALESFDDDFNHGFTYSGHPVASAVALANIKLMQETNIVERVRDVIGPYFQQRLRETLSDHPLVGHIEGVGLMAGIALVESKSPKTFFPADLAAGLICRDHCFNNGLIMRAVGNRMVLSPPLIINEAEIDLLCERARLCFDLTLDSLTSLSHP
jgi:putrescine aminotransferase